jgi:hypothetical protein
MTETLACFHCLEVGHHVAECPYLVKAANWKEHCDRIDYFRDRCIEWKISPAEKARMIKAENKLWYDGELPPSLKALSH